MIEIKSDFKINQGGNLNLHVKMVGADGEVMLDQPANSLVTNFMRILYTLFRNAPVPNSGMLVNFSEFNQADTAMKDTEGYRTISSVTVGNPTRITFSGDLFRLSALGNNNMQIAGVGDVTPDINGFYLDADVTRISDQIIDIAVDTTGSPAFVDEGAFGRIWQTYDSLHNPDTISVPDIMSDRLIKVGRDNTANVLDQQCLLNEWDSTSSAESFKLNYTLPTVSVPTFDNSAGEGEFILATAITNNSGANADLREIGLYGTIFDDNSDWEYTLVARDIVSTTLTAGASATLSYRIKMALGADGGPLKAFMQMLYTLFADGATQTVTDVYGTTFTTSREENLMAVVSGAGDSQGPVSTYSTTQGFMDDLGIQIGTGNTAVTINDSALETRIDHGTGSGEMLHYGTEVNNFQASGSVASFDIIKIFENQSGSQITINEIGLYGVGRVAINTHGDTEVACLYREVLSTPVAVPDGSVVKITITPQITVS